MADMEKQRGSLHSIFSERVAKMAVQLEKNVGGSVKEERSTRKGRGKSPVPETKHWSRCFPEQERKQLPEGS